MKKIEPLETKGFSFNDLLYRMDIGQTLDAVNETGVTILRVPNGWIFWNVTNQMVFVPYSLPLSEGGTVYQGQL